MYIRNMTYLVFATEWPSYSGSPHKKHDNQGIRKAFWLFQSNPVFLYWYCSLVCYREEKLQLWMPSIESIEEKLNDYESIWNWENSMNSAMYYAPKRVFEYQNHLDLKTTWIHTREIGIDPNNDQGLTTISFLWFTSLSFCAFYKLLQFNWIDLFCFS